MTCQQLVQLLIEFVSGELDPRFGDEIRQHLQDCASCEAYVQTYQLVITITRQLPPVPMPDHFVQRLEQILHQIDDFHRPES